MKNRPLMKEHLVRSGRYVKAHVYIKPNGKEIDLSWLFVKQIGHCSKISTYAEHRRRKYS